MKKEINTILSIDTSCDDTSVAVTHKNMVLSNVVSSQIEMHRKWGGTVPGIARLEHENRIDKVIETALRQAISNAKKSKQKGAINEIAKSDIKSIYNLIDAVAVTQGPGLAIALEVGIKKAKEISILYNLPIIAVDHMEGHLLSSFARGLNSQADPLTEINFPALGILISGGHTQIIYVKGFGKYEIIGETLDDALGEAYDKVARILKVGYPGGKVIEELAKRGDENAYKLPIAMQNSPDLNVSYSGLKTAVLYLTRDLAGESRVQNRQKSKSWTQDTNLEVSEEKINLNRKQIIDIAASFQNAAIETLINKVQKALKTHPVKSILLGGGVVSNAKVRYSIRKLARETKKGIDIQPVVYYPYSKKLFQDNAAMIGISAYLSSQRNSKDKYLPHDHSKLDRNPGMRLGQ